MIRSILKQAWKFLNFRETIYRYHDLTFTETTEMIFCFHRSILVETLTVTTETIFLSVPPLLLLLNVVVVQLEYTSLVSNIHELYLHEIILMQIFMQRSSYLFFCQGNELSLPTKIGGGNDAVTKRSFPPNFQACIVRNIY